MDIKLFNNQMFAKLDESAKSSVRRRSNCNIHEDYQASVQRLFITLYPDSYVRPHKHVQYDKWEFFLMISGEIAFLLFDDSGVCTHRYHLSATGENKGLEIPSGVWHAAVPLEQPATFFEVKQGPYIAMDDKGFASWAPQEGDTSVPDFLARLKHIQPGESVGGL
ncbi:WbuC family cupin fold metalloprotein [Planctobacterium marinum]|uniref:Cupin fold metalloprotein WbuC cupin domain-containing protein n=1 Tax=Planctobacterium marinum TaxID=1631968 RepID=A0AA48HJY2_9ALTE|nr:hypothetical protein MACH26_16370 [Planctobacterium marinum]